MKKRVPNKCKVDCAALNSMMAHIMNLEAERKNLKVVNRELMEAVESLTRKFPRNTLFIFKSKAIK